MDCHICTWEGIVEGIFLGLFWFRLRVKEAVTVGVRNNEQAGSDL